ncbi:MAG: low temperature requirement protein A [Acidimicrobiia bacterium]|nr:low temperature requirement protein A [Acidimicrobiia bacterium]
MEEDRSASFIELFFDLVFVFGITQVVAFIHGHLDWPTLGKAAIVLLLLWWLWTQFTWAAGYADFDDLGPRSVLLAATAGTFALAVAVQGSYADDGGTFALAYFGVMLLSAGFNIGRVWGTDEVSAFLAYLPRMLAGATLVLIGGFMSPDLRPWVWLAAVVVNFVSTIAVESNEYRIEASHFAERHGLFVIIVLGEVLIAIGLGVVGQDFDTAFYVAGTAMLLTALAMWWSYFDWIFQTGERALKAATGVARGRLARDGYSIAHYPLIAGVVLFAIGTEELLAHPADALSDANRWAFVGGLILFLVGESIMVRRFTHHVTWERFVAMSLLALVGLALGDLNAAALGATVCAVLIITLGVETIRHLDHLRELRSPSSTEAAH